MITPYLSLSCAVVAIYLCPHFEIPSFATPKIKEQEKEKEQKKEEEQPVETPSVAVDTSVKNENELILKFEGKKTFVSSYEYRDRKDIKIVIIPRSVEIICRGVFDGCVGIKAIYCEANEKPDEWNEDWCIGCNAPVHWGVSSKLVSELIDIITK